MYKKYLWEMNRIKRIFNLVHLVCWILFTILVAIQLSQETIYWPGLTAAVILTSSFVFYGHFILLTHYTGKKKKIGYFLMLAAIFVLAPFIYILLHYRKLNTWDLFSEYYFISMISIALPFFFLGWLARVTENLVINTVKKEQLEKQAVEAELYYLKSQLAPHFLFNTLNNIHTLVYKQAATAPEAVMQLASLMRYMIYESNAPMVPLAREMEYLQDYISLQQLRYVQRPVVDLKIEGVTATCQVAPLLFIHLLENAYKHSPARLNPGDVQVRVVVKNGILNFNVQNPIRNKSTAFDEPGGIGLPNIRKRLALLYPGQHALEVHQSGEIFVVMLTINSIQLHNHESKAHLLHH
jgi:hypothetical protein